MNSRPAPSLRRFALVVALALLAAAPAVVLRLAGAALPPLWATLVFGGALVAAGFLLSWGAETAEEHVSQGLALAGLALVTILPEYAVDIYYSFQAGLHPGSDYVQFAAANMTGANRLLIGTAWPLIALLFWMRSGRRAIALRPDNAVEILFLALPSIYAFAIVLKGQIDVVDLVVLLGLFVAYLWRVSKLPKGGRSTEAAADDEEDDDEEDEVGPAAALGLLSPRRQWAVITGLSIAAAGIIAIIAAPFAESLIASGTALHLNQFLLIQWLAPLAGEAPEVILTILFTWSLRPTTALGALVSDKINQWTLLVGMIPLFYSLGLGRLGALPLDARQHEEFFLTAAQSVFAVALLLRLRLTLAGGLALFGLFGLQVTLAWIFHADEARTIQTLTALAWFYLGATAVLIIAQRHALGTALHAALGHGPPAEDD